MYAFVDKMNGDHLALRPEGTAGVVRAMIEHTCATAASGWFYFGPCSATSGRKGPLPPVPPDGRRGLGFAGPDVDAEVILLARTLWRELGLVEGATCAWELNSLGQPEERRAHRAALINTWSSIRTCWTTEAKRRMHSNRCACSTPRTRPCRLMAEGAPKLLDFLGADSLARFDGVRALLGRGGPGLPHQPRLVRGLVLPTSRCSVDHRQARRPGHGVPVAATTA